MEIIKKELQLDILELFILTPLPGSEDHLNLWKQGVWMDSDLNKYDVGCAPNPYPPPALQRSSATALWAVRQIVLSRLRNLLPTPPKMIGFSVVSVF